jgi:hypothetical protein
MVVERRKPVHHSVQQPFDKVSSREAWRELSYGRVRGSGISRVLSPLARRRAISLGRRSPAASSSLPGTSPASRPDRRGPRLRPCLALLRVGFTMRRLLPAARCALTAPFHPYLCRRLPAGHRRFAFCGTFQRLAASGRYPAPCPAELGLSSAASWATAARTRFPTVNQRFLRTSAPRRSRTPNLRIRSPTLYPIELWARLRKNRPRFAVRPAGPVAFLEQPWKISRDTPLCQPRSRPGFTIPTGSCDTVRQPSTGWGRR